MNGTRASRFAATLLLVALVGSAPDGAVASTPEERATALELALNEAFRIDLSQIDVTYDLDPDAPTLDGRAELTFQMRPDQVRALFHFDPELESEQGTARETLRTLTLNGEALDPANDADVRVLQFDGSEQEAFELQRDLAPGTDHILVVEWTIWNYNASSAAGSRSRRQGSSAGRHGDGRVSVEPGWLRTHVNDTPGWGNEMLWPTINSPEEQALHTIEVRVLDDREYLMIGSGVITSRVEGDVTIWQLDTERELSSYTVMLAAMPVADVQVERFDAAGVPVVIASTESAKTTKKAVAVTVETMEELALDFGPFPMPSMHILLVGGGMEYYGATVTGLGALAHELVHMYWGVSAVSRTYRDSWFDEAVDEWWLGGRAKLPSAFQSDIAGGKPPIEPGFDERAYGQGSQVIRAIATLLGGRAAMIEFLADLHRRRAFEPFTTDELIDDLIAWSGDEALRPDIERWVYPVVVSSDQLSGVWQRRGYGEWLEINGRTWTEYEVTDTHCRRDGRSRARKTGAPRSIRGVAISDTGDELRFQQLDDLNRFHFERVAGGLPADCRTSGGVADPVLDFEAFWGTFAENFPFFAERGVDWDAQYAQYRPLIDANTSPDELLEHLTAMALPLNDRHATLRDEAIYSETPTQLRLRGEWQGSGGKKGFDAFLRRERKAFERRFADRYLEGRLKTAWGKRILWSRLNPNLGYLRIDELEGKGRSNVEKVRRILHRVIEDFEGVDAVVVDLRWNGGGSDEVGLAIAGFFTEVSQIAFTKRAVEGTGTGPEQTVRIWPQSHTPFLGPVFVLTSGFTASAAEVMNLALRARGDVTQVGESSMGAFSDSLDRTLPNGWAFSLSNEVYLDPADVLYEGTGFPVDRDAIFFAAEDRATGLDPGIETVLDAVANP